jgi:predicted DNA binding CopG/RHH family protein
MALKAGRPTGRTLTHVDRMKQQLEGEEERRLNVRMPKSEYQRLKRFALDQGMNISEVVRTALREYMKNVSQ